MAAVDVGVGVGVGHDDDLVVAQLVEVLGVADAGPERGDLISVVSSCDDIFDPPISVLRAAAGPLRSRKR